MKVFGHKIFCVDQSFAKEVKATKKADFGRNQNQEENQQEPTIQASELEGTITNIKEKRNE